MHPPARIVLWIRAGHRALADATDIGELLLGTGLVLRRERTSAVVRIRGAEGRDRAALAEEVNPG